MYCCDDVLGYIQIEKLCLGLFLIECFFFQKENENIIQEKNNNERLFLIRMMEDARKERIFMIYSLPRVRERRNKPILNFTFI